MNSRHTRPAPSRGPVAPMHRSAGAVSSATHVGPPAHAPNAALLIDFDNVTMGIRSDLQTELRNLLSSDIVKGKVAVQRAYADWRRYPQYILPLTESSIDLIFAPAYGSSKKNATDIRLAIDAIELVFTRPEIGTIILLSGDSDFSSLVIKLKEYGKYIIGVGIRESSSDLLVMNCDEYYSYNSLAGLVKSSDDEAMSQKRDPWELVSDAIQRMKKNGDVMRSDRLKQVMQEIDSSFDEKDLGMSKFSRFVQEAAHKGLVHVTKLDNGQLEVAPPQSSSSAEPATSAAATPAARDGASADEERGPRRGRRGGRGRGRDREERAPRTDDTAINAASAARDVPDAAVPIEAPPAESAAPTVTRAARVPADAPPPPDRVGLSGERLTRDEAFGLVRRAVESLVRGDAAARASDVRARACDLLGRDSESLSERNFARILRDAHDGDVVDLRRRGDDYEVGLAAEAAPVAEQLSRAEAANTPAPAPAGAPAPRGMGPRAGVLRGRGVAAPKPGTLPEGLLALGVVASARATTAPVTTAGTDRKTPSARAETDDAEGRAAPVSVTKRGRARAKVPTAGVAKPKSKPRAKAKAPAGAESSGDAPDAKPRRPRARKATARVAV